MSVQVKGSGTIGGIDEGLNTVGVITATSFVGALPITNDANNKIITSTGSGGLNAETNLTFDGTGLLSINVPSATGQPSINFENSDTGTGTGNGFGIGIDNAESPFIYNRENTALRIGTNNQERLRIASDGQLTHNYDIGSNGDAGVILNTDDATKASSILFRANNENRARIDVQRLAGDGAQLKIQVSQMNNSNTMLDAMTIAPVTSGDTTPDVTLAGNLKFASGGGIDFSATGNSSGTMSSELLDDYEEGSWTPNPSGSGTINGTSIAYSGKYTRVGNLVTLEFYANNSAGNINIPSYKIFTGLPFVTASGSYGTGRIMSEDGEVLDRQGDIIVGGSTFLINKCGSSSGTVRLSGTVTYIAT